MESAAKKLMRYFAASGEIASNDLLEGLLASKQAGNNNNKYRRIPYPFILTFRSLGKGPYLFLHWFCVNLRIHKLYVTRF